MKRKVYHKGHDAANHPGASRADKFDHQAGIEILYKPAYGLTDPAKVPWNIEPKTQTKAH